MTPIICTGSDHKFAILLTELLRSIRGNAAANGIALGVLDLGLTSNSRRDVARYANHIVEPGWDIPIFKATDCADQSPWKGFRAMTARPYLPKYFPGYDVYVWIDADAWVQDWSAVEAFIAVAANGSMAIVPELHHTYAVMYDHGETRRWMHDNYVRFFGSEVAQSLWHFPILNSGVFSLRPDMPHWGHWAEDMTAAIARVADFTAEQTALNHAVYTRRLRFKPLPARFNWLVNKALPKFDPDKALFTEPSLPYEPLGIVHLSGTAKRTAHLLNFIRSRDRIRTSLRYRLGRRHILKSPRKTGSFIAGEPAAVSDSGSAGPTLLQPT